MSNYMRKSFKGLLYLCVAALLLLSCTPLSSAVGPELTAAPDAGQHAEFQAAVEAAVVKAFVGLADRLAPAVSTAITPNMDTSISSRPYSLKFNSIRKKK